MKIKFKSIKIENFKAIELLETDFANKTYVYGANETGKTSFADAISWCLTGKNSLGDSQFNFLPIGKNEVSPSVTLDIEIQDEKNVKPVTLTRIYQAKINRSKEFTGEYSTIYFINKLKVGPKEFERWVEDHICTPEIFRLIHDVRYFTENIATSGRERPWEAQRRLLFTIAGINTDIIFAGTAKNKKRFGILLDGLGRYDNANQYLSFLKSEEKRIESAIQQNNLKLETMSSMYSTVDDTDVNSKIKTLKNELESKSKEFNDAQAEYSKRGEELLKERNRLYSECNDITVKARTVVSDLKTKEDALTKISIQCPTCGQYIPTEIIDAEREKIREEIDDLKNRHKKLKKKYLESKAQLEKTEKESLDLKQPVFSEELKIIQEKIDSLTREYIKFRMNQKLEKDTKDIKAKNKILLDERARNAQLLDLCKEFIDAKCKCAEKKINDLFDGIEFKMFRQNKTNGDIKECCDIYWNNTPYSSLSYSTKFVVSMKIALAFQKFYGVEMPLIVDNAESINFADEFTVQSILLTKREEYCKCGSETERKSADGMWTCKKCKNRFRKTLEIITE